MNTSIPSARAELLPAFKYIFLAGMVFWMPAVFLFTDLVPLQLFNNFMAVIASLMFFSGAVVANATSVGGGIVFNPLLQLVFEVSGFSALVLSITVQCAGMPSGTYGWYKKGMYRKIVRHDLFLMMACCVGSTVACTLLFLICIDIFPADLLAVMKLASAFVSFYVFVLLWREIGETKSPNEDVEPRLPNSGSLHWHATASNERLHVDGRIYPWIAFGALLNVFTAVGVGELTFAHLIKYYKSPAKWAVALGTMMQATSVITQTLFNLVFMRDYLIVPLVWIGLLFTMVGGRLAPYIITRGFIEPYIKHALALTALAMGMTSLVMLLIR